MAPRQSHPTGRECSSHSSDQALRAQEEDHLPACSGDLLGPDTKARPLPWPELGTVSTASWAEQKVCGQRDPSLALIPFASLLSGKQEGFQVSPA